MARTYKIYDNDQSSDDDGDNSENDEEEATALNDKKKQPLLAHGQPPPPQQQQQQQPRKRHFTLTDEGDLVMLRHPSRQKKRQHQQRGRKQQRHTLFDGDIANGQLNYDMEAVRLDQSRGVAAGASSAAAAAAATVAGQHHLPSAGKDNRAPSISSEGSLSDCEELGGVAGALDDDDPAARDGRYVAQDQKPFISRSHCNYSALASVARRFPRPK